jgi:hypothetical protein
LLVLPLHSKTLLLAGMVWLIAIIRWVERTI